MSWFDIFDFLLFDFDGLLVDTEKLHFQAYQKMLAHYDQKLDWSFADYCSLAHADDVAVKNAIYRQFPPLKNVPWKKLYQKKKELYMQLLIATEIDLMPGVKELLMKIGETGKKSCVVTHSLKELVDAIRRKNPLLQNIPHWITREDYSRPKPAPDGYLKALNLYGRKTAQEKVIGFEDTIRGLKALRDSCCIVPVLICSPDHPQMQSVGKDILHFTSFKQLNNGLLSEKAL